MEFRRYSFVSAFTTSTFRKDLKKRKIYPKSALFILISTLGLLVSKFVIFLAIPFFGEPQFGLPSQEYACGVKGNFNAQLHSESQLQYGDNQTIGSCSHSFPVDVKTLNSVAIKDKYQKMQETVASGSKEEIAKKCIVNGQTYEHNEWFNKDCNARCRCVNGKLGCVDMCPPFKWSLKADQTCREVNVAGKCCLSVACVNREGQKITYRTKNQIKTDTKECKLKPLEKVQDDFTQEYPSVVFVCDEQCQRSRFNPAVIINNKWVMIHGNGSWDQTNTFVHVTRPSIKPLQFKIEKAIKHETENLMLLQISEYLPNTLQVQAVNLPLTKNHCENLMTTGCSLINPTWKEANENSIYSEVQSMIFNKGEFASRNLCNQPEQDKSALCLAFTPETCSKSSNGPLFVSDGRLDFFLGMQSSSNMEDNINFRSMVVAHGISVCKALDWIRSTIAN